MKNTKKSKKLITEYLLALEQLHLVIFSAYLKRDYFENKLVYEKKLVKQTQKLFQILARLRKFFHGDFKVIGCFENLYEIFFSMDLLKYRLLDHATFEVCEPELKKISHAISLALAEKENSLLMLHEAIQSFEVVFQITLQFIIADPLFFLFFIRDLKSLHDELKHLVSFQYD